MYLSRQVKVMNYFVFNCQDLNLWCGNLALVWEKNHKNIYKQMRKFSLKKFCLCQHQIFRKPPPNTTGKL